MEAKNHIVSDASDTGVSDEVKKRGGGAMSECVEPASLPPGLSAAPPGEVPCCLTSPALASPMLKLNPAVTGENILP